MGKSTKSTISMTIFNGYVRLPEGTVNMDEQRYFSLLLQEDTGSGAARKFGTGFGLNFRCRSLDSCYPQFCRVITGNTSYIIMVN